MKVLNLYAGIGGNRKLWEGVEVVAVEYNAEIAAIYQNHFPQDEVVVGDAHEYLLNHFNEFDFIWTSPPCQSHSSFRQNIGVRFRGVQPVYPDMRLYQEIIFLQYNAKCKWVVENVKPYYEPLIKPTSILQRHYFWANFPIPQRVFEQDIIREAQIPDLCRLHGFDITNIKIKDKRQILRNCVYPPIGKHIFESINLETELKLAI